MKSLNELGKEIYATACEKGWWDQERSFGDIIALCHSELSEALEAYRNREPVFYLDPSTGKPEGLASELADTIIRILDYCAKTGIDMEAVMEAKMNYNKTRSYRHGGKKI